MELKEKMTNDNIRVGDGLETATYDATFDDVYQLGLEDRILIIDGDLEIIGHFSDWYEAQIKQHKLEPSVVIVDGDLLVTGDILDPELLVMGNLKCDYLYSGAATLKVCGDCDIRFAYFGRSPHGECSIVGTTKVPFLFNEDHVSIINPGENTIVIGINVDGYFDYDLCHENFSDVFVPSVLVHGDTIDTEAFFSWIRDGRSPFKNVSDETFSLEFDKSAILKKIKNSEDGRK